MKLIIACLVICLAACSNPETETAVLAGKAVQSAVSLCSMALQLPDAEFSAYAKCSSNYYSAYKAWMDAEEKAPADDEKIKVIALQVEESSKLYGVLVAWFLDRDNRALETQLTIMKQRLHNAQGN